MTRSVPVAPRLGDDWWQRGVVYQIYPRSFADSDGDGVGDLPGITERLPYLGPDGLDVDAIWLSPVYPSPGRDIGYDVSDHTAIDPQFGSEADFDRLVDEAHRLGLRVVMDLVMNHTSDVHPWFDQSRASKDGPYADWYIWRDPAGVDRNGSPMPPNDWVSWFGGPAWTYRSRSRPVLPPHVPRGAAGTRLAGPGRGGGPVRDGPRLAGPWRGWLPTGHVQRVPQTPGHAR